MVPMFLFTLRPGTSRTITTASGHHADDGGHGRGESRNSRDFGVRRRIYWIYVCLFIGGTARTFSWAANAAFLPALVDRKDFPRAVNWNARHVFSCPCIVGRQRPAPSSPPMSRHYDFSRRAGLMCSNVLASLVFCVPHRPGTAATHPLPVKDP